MLASCSKMETSNCGVLFEYSEDFMSEAAIDYDNSPAKSKRLIDDYAITRKSIRACLDRV